MGGAPNLQADNCYTVRINENYKDNFKNVCLFYKMLKLRWRWSRDTMTMTKKFFEAIANALMMIVFIAIFTWMVIERSILSNYSNISTITRHLLNDQCLEQWLSALKVKLAEHVQIPVKSVLSLYCSLERLEFNCCPSWYRLNSRVDCGLKNLVSANLRQIRLWNQNPGKFNRKPFHYFAQEIHR